VVDRDTGPENGKLTATDCPELIEISDKAGRSGPKLDPLARTADIEYP